MDETIIGISRETLYNEVWTCAMTSLANKYGLSDVGLRKICKKMRIPLPPQGYHLRKFKGRKTALPVCSDVPHEHTFHIPTIKPKDPESRDDLIPEIVFERQEGNRIIVPDKLVSPHPLVASAAKALAKQKADDYGRIHIHWKASSGISIFPGSVDRVLGLLDSLIKALRRRNFFPLNDTDAFQVQMLGESIPISVFEQARRKDHRPTAGEAERRWFYTPKYDYFPTGDLQIRTADYYPRVLLSETRKKRLEDNLNEVIIRLIRYALREKEERLKREKELEERREKEQRRRALLEAIHQEKQKVHDLEVEAENWYRAQRIRGYIEAVAMARVPGDPNLDDASIDQWITWAQQQADRLDPLVESPPSILDELRKCREPY